MLLSRYAKAVAGVLVTVGAFVASVLTDGISPQEWVLIAGTGASAVGVGIVPNLPSGVAEYAKGFVAFFVAGSTALSVLILGGLTVAEAIEVGVVAFAAIGVTVLKGNATA